MALDLVIAEARDLPEDSLMEVVRFIRAIKTRHEDSITSQKNQPVIREAGRYRGQIVVSDDFDEPIEAFKEYM